jgi:hypothetical protein
MCFRNVDHVWVVVVSVLQCGVLLVMVAFREHVLCALFH